MKKLAILFTLLAACTNSSEAKRTLSDAGYEDIKITGYSPLSCGEDDFSSTGFKAKNPKGKVVEGVVCCGMVVKSCTIRH